MRKWIALGLGAITAVALTTGATGTPAAPAAAQSGQTFQVVAGGRSEAGKIELNAFFPRVLTVSTGDTVNWDLAGFHTVTFNAGRPPLTDIIPGPGAGELTIGPAQFPFPPGPTPPTGPYDGTTQISSGPPNGDDGPPFTLTFTRAGVYTYVCSIHPGMEGAVTVLPSGSALPETPAQATNRGDSDAAGLIAGMNAYLPQVLPATGTAPGAATVHTGLVGFASAGGASVFRFLPDAITVRRGDLVEWTLADPLEIHTVTFLSGSDAPAFVEPRPNPMGPPTLVIPANVAGPAGSAVYTGQGYVSSGIVTPGNSFVLTFDAPAGVYQYQCLVHPQMIGTITVVE